MSSAVEVSKAYWESLEKLVDNNRIRIGSLTELAFEYSTEFAPLITKLIEERIRKVRELGNTKRIRESESLRHVGNM